MRYFKKPKTGMALTALAGPVSNFLLALALLFTASLLAAFAPVNGVVVGLFSFCANTAVLSIGPWTVRHRNTPATRPSRLSRPFQSNC